MKKLFFAILATTVLSVSTTALASEISVKIDNKEISFDQSPLTVDGRTLVPMRGIFQELGMVVEWNNDTKTITAKKDGKEIIMQLNSNQMIVDGNKITLEVPAQSINGRTVVPVRAISEALEIDVAWDKQTKTVVIGQGAKEINALYAETSTKKDVQQQVEETSELIKQANEYMAKTNILNNCKDSVALIQNPKSIADLKTNLNAMTGYDPNTMKVRDDYNLVSMEQVITIDGKSLESYHDFGNYKNRVVGAVKLDVYDPNSTITFTRFITREGEIVSYDNRIPYANDGKELRIPFIWNNYIGTADEGDAGLITGLLLKDNIVVGKLDYATSDRDLSLMIELFDEYKNEQFDSIALNLDASNYLDGYSNNINLMEPYYVSAIIKLPKIEFVDYHMDR